VAIAYSKARESAKKAGKSPSHLKKSKAKSRKKK
jgi:hypothetical protein